jgi:hypothetical protein
MPSILRPQGAPQQLASLPVGHTNLHCTARRLTCSAAAEHGVNGVDGVGGAEAPGAAARKVAALFQQQAKHPTLSLERAVGDKHGIDRNLWDSCHFQAEVYPDLPVAATWRDLLRRTLQTPGHESEAGRMEPPPARCPADRWTVRTVAAQLRSRDQLRSMMLSAAGVDPAGDPKAGVRPADALLFVSGSHPARHLPGAGRWVVESSARCGLFSLACAPCRFLRRPSTPCFPTPLPCCPSPASLLQTAAEQL